MSEWTKWTKQHLRLKSGHIYENIMLSEEYEQVFTLIGKCCNAIFPGRNFVWRQSVGRPAGALLSVLACFLFNYINRWRTEPVSCNQNNFLLRSNFCVECVKYLENVIEYQIPAPHGKGLGEGIVKADWYMKDGPFNSRGRQSGWNNNRT